MLPQLLTQSPRLPISTYRLQLNRFFRFSNARKIILYLHALGITNCYTSSFLTAIPGSLHGYDLTDPNSLNPEIGTEEEYRVFVETLQSHDMGQIFDVVSNHMGSGKAYNTWWLDLLENGPSSVYASFFDVNWHPVKPELKNKVLLPILGDQYGAVLERQEIQLACENGAFFAWYDGHKLSIAQRSSANILVHQINKLIQVEDRHWTDVVAFRSIVTAIKYLTGRDTDAVFLQGNVV